jgi:hypothetical protein
MIRFVALPTVLWAAAAIAAGAQQRPNFSGSWTLVDSSGVRPSVAATGDAAFRTGDMGSGWGSPLTITQRADSLIVEYTVYTAYDLQPPIRLACALDGSESRNVVMIGHAESTQRCRVAWQDSSLVVTTAHPLPSFGNGQPGVIEVRQALTLVSPTSLIVQTTRAGVLGGPATTTRTVYIRR